MTYVDYIPDKIYLRIGILIRWINKPPRTFSNFFSLVSGHVPLLPDFVPLFFIILVTPLKGVRKLSVWA